MVTRKPKQKLAPPAPPKAELDSAGYHMKQSRGQVAFIKIAKGGVIELDGYGAIEMHAGDYLMRRDGDLTPVSAEIVERFWFPARQPELVCRKCGCTQEDACAGGCGWTKQNLCSSCAPTRK